ncbi:MAG: DUF4089 domain-containing protein [Rubrivivax sp.]|nr:DUF4089 domain-containing protein [Rubrivivax sp.]
MDHHAAYVDAAAAVLGLKIATEYRPGVLRFFGLAAAMAEQVMSLPLDASDEPGTAFVPVAPRRGE